MVRVHPGVFNLQEIKIKTLEEIAVIVEKCKSDGKTIGFTSGVFDIFHYGHASYLKQAKSLCDILIVAVNSDDSVRKNKGPNRPIISEKERVELISALKCVDYAYVFFETNNKNNILTLKPNFYIKGGDYNASSLTSAEYMKAWGGIPIIIPLEKGFSSSNIINKIKGIDPPLEKCKAIFLDRDGVLNENIPFLHEPEKLNILPGVITGLKELMKLGFKLVIITNQQGIGLGYYSKEDFFSVNSKMLRYFAENDIAINKIYFCPHSHAENCKCRKPKSGMIFSAKEDLNIDLSKSFLIGDSDSDILAGKEACVESILVSKDLSFQNAVDTIKNHLKCI